MKKDLNEVVNTIYLLEYSYNSRKHYTTSYLTEKRAKEHMQYLIEIGAIEASIKEINLWME